MLPRHPTRFVASKTLKNIEVVKLPRKPVSLPRKPNRPIKVKHNSSNLDSKIWFMLNLENAFLGKLKNIPTSWFVQMLKDTRDVETSSPGRLIKEAGMFYKMELERRG